MITSLDEFIAKYGKTDNMYKYDNKIYVLFEGHEDFRVFDAGTLKYIGFLEINSDEIMNLPPNIERVDYNELYQINEEKVS